jgi:hypothetical protein
LVAGGAVLSYPALTGFCRRQGIGQTPVVRSSAATRLWPSITR